MECVVTGDRHAKRSRRVMDHYFKSAAQPFRRKISRYTTVQQHRQSCSRLLPTCQLYVCGWCTAAGGDQTPTACARDYRSRIYEGSRYCRSLGVIRTTRNRRKGANKRQMNCALREGQTDNKYGCDLMPQQRGLIGPTLYTS